MKNQNETYTKQQIANMLVHNDKAVVRGLIRIYERQTEDEQYAEETHDRNNVGFNGVDAPILSSFVKFYQKSGYLSPKQMAIARKKMIKYAGQLANIANQLHSQN